MSMSDQDKRMSEAANAMADGNWQVAYKLMMSLAEEGVTEAEHCMGWFCEQGLEVQQSDKAAFQWWSKSASKGMPESQNGLAQFYQYGRGGVEIDLEKSYYWYSLAFKNGDSQSRLGKEELEKNFTEAQLKSLNERINADKKLLNLNSGATNN